MSAAPLHRRLRAAGLAALALAVALGAAPLPASAAPGIEIRRTTDGIPHVRADSWHGLGLGIGYAQAEDALCTLAEAYTTYAGRRSLYFGPEARPARDATFGRPRNLELDFFFRAFADDTMVARYRADQPAELVAMIEGYAEGYNRHLREQRRRSTSGHACLGAAWLREIGPADVYRRLYAAQIAGGYANLIPEIVNAQPPGARGDAVVRARAADQLPARLTQRVGGQLGLGSNMLAFGGRATGGQGGVLLGNPHWYWGGPDRFHQMHLTLPGRLNVAGVAFLGVPMVMIGFNEQVAWSHTVSAARRFGLFELALDPQDAAHYLVDGRSQAMEARTVSIEVATRGGKPRQLARTLYRTRFGPVVDLHAHDPAFGWSRARALAMRDVNDTNFRAFRTFFGWNRARSLDEFIDIQRRDVGMPWVNTAAIARQDARVWYADVSNVPDVPDRLRQECSTPLAKAFAAVDPLTPFLDGSRSSCDWRIDPDAAQAGSTAAHGLPALLREDYVANMNDSYWLANARHPLEGFPGVLGGERQPLSMRSRMGHQIAQELLDSAGDAPGPSAERLSQRLRQAALDARLYPAEHWRASLLVQACQDPAAVVSREPSASGVGPASDGARRVALAPACAVLRRWSGRGEADARGALLWETFWSELGKTPEDGLYRVAFSPAAPLQTPTDPGAAAAPQALARAVLSLRARGVALDAPLGTQRYVRSGRQHIALFGGCHDAGYFAVACKQGQGNRLDADAAANSYLQVVHFDPRGVQAYTLLAHGQGERALNGGPGISPVLRYARKQWLRFPFHDEDIERDPALRRRVLGP